MELKERKKNLIERNSDLEGMNQELEKLLAANSQKTIPDALARTMEQTFSKPKGWLDQWEGDQGNSGCALNYDLFGG